ncbi:hypothetical protein AZE42_05930 [Rhizopogon vesiculosus]|uniref:ATP-dependent DNA helicase n=1 Tax=Rhizopogon vesiculosus TaxID=180088 RepID=A0A1J8PFC5_9AGAM|nr:hypothetical protein AZE42_05930 [Rhizopogon vesiculosus]
MPVRYYAVRIGREGPKIYSNYHDFQMAICGLSGSSGKGFDTYREAEAWLTGVPMPAASVTNVTSQTTTTMVWEVSSDSHQGSTLASTSTTISYQTGARPYPEPQPGRRWFEYESPLNTRHARPNGDRLTPPPPYIPLARYNMPREPELPPPLPPQPAVELSEEQKQVLRLVQNGKNIFFTGPAGTGKSVLLRAIIDMLRVKFGGEVAITAPTGIAGVNIGGSTIYSWAGIRLGKEGVQQLLVVSGDFFQLPPVPDQDSTTIIPSTFAFDALSWSRCIDEPVSLTKVFRQKDNKFVDMLSATRSGKLLDWHIREFMKLKRVVDYSDGISPTQLFPLKSQVESCNKTHLDVLSGEQVTYSAMDSRGFDMHENRIPIVVAEQLLDRLVVPKVISLKIGAQVMLLRNLLQGKLVNGSLGKVIDFMTTHEATQCFIEIANLDTPAQRAPNGDFLPTLPPGVDDEDKYKGLLALDRQEFTKHERFPLVRFTNDVHLLCAPLSFTVEGLKGNVEAQRIQVPLVLAWAMSIHKAQGQTMTRVKVDLQRIFEKGQAYVALSRATSLEGLEVIGFDPSRVLAHPRVIDWQASWQAQRDQEEEMDMDWAIEQYYSSTDISV